MRRVGRGLDFECWVLRFGLARWSLRLGAGRLDLRRWGFRFSSVEILRFVSELQFSEMNLFPQCYPGIPSIGFFSNAMSLALDILALH